MLRPPDRASWTDPYSIEFVSAARLACRNAIQALVSEIISKIIPGWNIVCSFRILIGPHNFSSLNAVQIVDTLAESVFPYAKEVEQIVPDAIEGACALLAATQANREHRQYNDPCENACKLRCFRHVTVPVLALFGSVARLSRPE